VTGERPSSGEAAVPVLHVVTDDDVLARADFPELAAALAAAGGGRAAIHVRGPHADGGLLYRLTRALVEPARASGALLVVNDRVDVALAAGAGAVQLGRRSLPPADARRILGPGARVGVSTHDDAEVAEAVAEGAHWIFAGTIYATPSHEKRAPRGPGAMPGACGAAGHVPVLAIGGVTPERVAEVCRAGAHGVAVIRGIWSDRDPLDALGRYLDALTEAAGEGAEAT